MTPELILFPLSFLAIVFLVCHKMYEQKLGASVLFVNVREKGDALAHRVLVSVRSKVPTIDREHIKSNLQLTAAFIRRFWNTFRTFLRERYAEFEHAMKRQAMHRSKLQQDDKSSSSFFLRSIGKPEAKEIK